MDDVNERPVNSYRAGGGGVFEWFRLLAEDFWGLIERRTDRYRFFYKYISVKTSWLIARRLFHMNNNNVVTARDRSNRKTLDENPADNFFVKKPRRIRSKSVVRSANLNV